MSETIYFVDESGQPTGEVSEKLAAHTATTKLHAAFSCYLFNEQGRFLVTQRAPSKKVWPTVWTNSCCGHPAPGESTEDAIRRRLDYELGMTASDFKVVLPEYRYRTPPYNGIVENEFCPLYVAMATGKPKPNPAEVQNARWVDWAWFIEQAENDSNDYSDPASKTAPVWSWWCKDQLQTMIRRHGRAAVLALATTATSAATV